MNPSEQWLRKNRLFRSAASGLWYSNPRSAGSIDAIQIAGRFLYRNDGELTLPWIRRCAEFAENYYHDIEPPRGATR